MTDPGAIKVYRHEWLPPGTITVSPDIWELMQAGFNFDTVFTKACGIDLSHDASSGRGEWRGQ